MFTVRILAGLLAVGMAVGCAPKNRLAVDYNRELPANQMALRKIGIDAYPAFSLAQSNRTDLAASIDHSIQYLRRASSKLNFPYLDISHDRALATLLALKEIVANAPAGISDEDLSHLIADKFDVYQSIGAPNADGAGYTNSVLFTAYCTPIYEASLTRSGAFQYPLYKRPDDLIADPITGDVKGRKTADGTIVPYYSRRQIEEDGVLAGQELVWLKSRWEAYVITVQGSARLHLPDGRTMEIGYSGGNGLDYVSPGMQLVNEQKITKDQLSLRSLTQYFQIHPEQVDHYVWLNPRYVFFAETTGGPYGAMNVPVTPMATIATDKEVYPWAMPAFLEVPVPAITGPSQPFRGFMLDQDRGGAIRAAGRTDIYMGIGPQAQQEAGQQLNTGKLYYIAVKPALVHIYLKQVEDDPEQD
jgi:membrane-bound lytic murein transglycosylase A